MNARAKYLRDYYTSHGFVAAILHVVKSILRILNRRKYQRFVQNLGTKDHAAVFSEIYKKGLWKGGKSYSGAGSEFLYTENLRFFLPIIFDRFSIRTIVDAPCGDFNWMQLVPLTKEMSYVGIDIVSEVISKNRKRHETDRRRFIVADIITDPLPTADILICRDCLFHLSNEDIVLLLKNFINSRSAFFLTNTHVNRGHFVNKNIKTGEFRLVDLFSEPFYFPTDVRYRVDDFVHPFPPREMCLWDRAQIISAIEKK